MDSVIKKIVEETPNDMELGEKIREMYWKNRELEKQYINCLLYTSPSPRDNRVSRMPSSA